MAINYANLSKNEALASEYLYQFLNESGIFDSVSLDVATNSVSGTYNGTEIFKAVFNGSDLPITWCGSVVRTFGNLYTYHVGKTSKGVVLGAVPSNVADIYFLIISKSEGGIPMIVYRNDPSEGEYCKTADYSSAPQQCIYLPRHRISGDFYAGYQNANYSLATAICTEATGTETVAVADGVQSLIIYQTNIPTNLLTEITIDEVPALAVGVQDILLD